MICECCGIEAATKQVRFYQNIGAFVVRFHKSIAGSLCKSCINQYFWKFTLTNCALGWWGTVSFFITPFLILNNIIRYMGTLGLSRVPDGAVATSLTESEVRRIDPFAYEIASRLNGDEKLSQICPDVSYRAGVTPGQVFLYVQMVMNSESA
jgi:hypothetical protein